MSNLYIESIDFMRVLKDLEEASTLPDVQRKMRELFVGHQASLACDRSKEFPPLRASDVEIVAGSLSSNDATHPLTTLQ